VSREDKRHRFALRIDNSIHFEVDAMSFGLNISLNLAYTEAIKYAMTSDGFREMLKDKYREDKRRGQYLYIRDSETKTIGRNV
jgi:hypothetical protein